MGVFDSLTLLVLLGLFYRFLVYPFFLHPLRRIPAAHWTVSFPYLGALWILYQRYERRNNRTALRAHQELGPVVRLGYNELSINCVDDGIRTVYGAGWEKHEWYARQFAGYDVINMFTTVHRGPHSLKKRTMANIYAKSSLQSSPQIAANSAHLLQHRFLPLLQSLSDSGTPTDVHAMNNAFTMDFMSAYLFGLRQSTNFTQDTQARAQLMHLYHSRRDYEWHSAEVPPQLRRVIDALHIPFVPKAVADANEILRDWNTKLCENADAYLEQFPEPANADYKGDDPVVYRHFMNGMAKLRQNDLTAGMEFLPHIFDPSPYLTSEKGLRQLSRNELFSEMFDHLGAGHETSAIALTYLYWEMSRHRNIQRRLHQEVSGLEPQILWPQKVAVDALALPSPKAIDALPYLEAVVLETLRLHAPIPGNEPRVSPHVPGGSKLGPYTNIPGGVRVSSMAYTLHRNPDVFPQPETFNPDRWLTSSENQLKEMHRWFWAFGSGGRMCIGSHLALQEIKLLVAAVYTNWQTEIVDDDGIEEMDIYTTRPRSNQLILRFVHR